MFDMNNMMGKLQEVQANLQKAQEELVNIYAEGESGGGMVKAKVNGKKQVVDIDFDDSIVNTDDKEMLQDLTIAAVNKALENVEEQVNEHMKKSTGGILPNIPGLDFSQFTGR